ncbi:MAG: UDP-3-O-(3-hydroxymyristoyl)glucosamine N-acyltransferase [Cyanobacteria bacterium]|nr:UDP-3-O-(3-hydroxymyristoyl)glucosamine N-acyltransferase [Cyanobacteriota bacterium]
MKLPVPMTVAQIAGFIGGQVHGKSDLSVSGIATDPLASTENDVALVIDKEILKSLSAVKAGVVIAPVGTEKSYPDRNFILVERPKLAIQRICTALNPRRFMPEPGVHPSAVVDPTAELAEGVAVGALVVIGPKTKIGKGTVIMPGTIIGGMVQIGSGCLIHPGCLIADYVQIGERVILQQGASIGPDGFGYTTEKPANAELLVSGVKELPDVRNPLLKIPQIGTVIIEDDVEIGSNTTIDRATIGATVIGAGSKIDNLVQIAHNCEFGKDTIVAAHTAVAGSCKVEDRAIFAGGVRIKDHITIGKDAILQATAAVMRDVPSQDIQVGIPAINTREFFKQQARIRRLPKVDNEIKELKERVKQLEELLAARELAAK